MRWKSCIQTVVFAALVASTFGMTWEHGTEIPVYMPDVATSTLHPDHPWYVAGRAKRQAAHVTVSALADFSQSQSARHSLNGLVHTIEDAEERLDEIESNAPAEAVVRISSRFGMRYHPILRRWKAHNGVDYAAPRGTPVRSVAAGTVVFAGWSGGAGRLVKIQHDGYESAYAHLSRIAPGIEPGVELSEAQFVGKVGASGLATGHHLHFSIKVDGKFVDPMRDGQTRIEPIEEAQFLVDFERGVTRTLTEIHVSTLDIVRSMGDSIEGKDVELEDIWFDDTFL